MGSTNSTELPEEEKDQYPACYYVWKRDMERAWQKYLFLKNREPKWDSWVSLLNLAYERWKQKFDLSSKENKVYESTINDISKRDDTLKTSYRLTNVLDENSMLLEENIRDILNKHNNQLKETRDNYEKEDKKWQDCLKQAKIDWDNSYIFIYAKKML